MRTARLGPALLGIVAAFLIGCGGDEGGGGGGATGGQTTPEAKKLDPASAQNPKGNINWCIGKDTSNTYKPGVKAFNKANPGATAKLVELPESADEQRTQLTQRLRAKSAECDVLGLDVIWTAEFAAQGWLMDASDVIAQRKGEFIESTLDSASYSNKHWAIPYHSNAGFLYYRNDQVDQAPESWEDVYQQAQQQNGVIYQGARYEGLTVHFLELLYSAGGEVLSEDGQSVLVNSEQGKQVLQFMADGFKNGAVPKAVSTYKEEEARRAFESGKVTFMRNWPYAYGLGQAAPKIKGKFDITPFPSYGGGEGAGVLGGFNLGVSAFSKNPGGALALVNYLTGAEHQLFSATKANPPVRAETYDDAKAKKALPFADQLRQAITQAKPRPVSPVYQQISQAIYKNVHDAITGKAQPDAALTKMQQEIDQALKTF